MFVIVMRLMRLLSHHRKEKTLDTKVRNVNTLAMKSLRQTGPWMRDVKEKISIMRRKPRVRASILDDYTAHEVGVLNRQPTAIDFLRHMVAEQCCCCISTRRAKV